MSNLNDSLEVLIAENASDFVCTNPNVSVERFEVTRDKRTKVRNRMANFVKIIKEAKKWSYVCEESESEIREELTSFVDVNYNTWQVTLTRCKTKTVEGEPHETFFATVKDAETGVTDINLHGPEVSRLYFKDDPLARAFDYALQRFHAGRQTVDMILASKFLS